MQELLSTNKISRPRMTGILPRQRLFHLLDAGLERPVIWVHGPGGSGKSTLVASYLDSRQLPAVWYQVDSRDTDIATFFYYMGLAAKKAAPRSRTPLPLLTPEYQSDTETFAHRYFEKLFSSLKPPCLLVLDDYHEVGSESPLHQLLKHAFAQVPHGVNIAVISRMPPPAVMARLCAGRQISFIGCEDLRLTAEETGEIVRLHGKERQFEPTFDRIYDKIRGWVAGLVLLGKKPYLAVLRFTGRFTMICPDLVDAHGASHRLADVPPASWRQQQWLEITITAENSGPLITLR